MLHERLAHQDGVGAGGGVPPHLLLRLHPGLGDAHDVLGQVVGEGRVAGRIDVEGLQVADVHAQDPGARGHAAGDLLGGVGLDEGVHAQRLGELPEPAQLGVVEGGHDEQDQVGAVGARLEDLVLGDHEVLAQDRHRDRATDGVEVVEAAVEAALLGEDADRRGPRLGVGARQGGGVGDGGEGALAGAGPLDLRDEREAVGAQALLGVDGGGGVVDPAGQVGQAHPVDAGSEVLTDPGDDGVEHRGHGRRLRRGWCRRARRRR